MATGAGMRGQAAMRKRIEAVGRRFPSKVGVALYRAAELIMTDSKRNYVPVDLGNLRASGHVELPTFKGKKVSVALVYGGPAAKYALAVHEHPSAHSPRSWKGTVVQFSPKGHGPKYLERPLLAAIPHIMEDMRKDVDLGGVL